MLGSYTASDYDKSTMLVDAAQNDMEVQIRMPSGRTTEE
jgi:hypothetical protein